MKNYLDSTLVKLAKSQSYDLGMKDVLLVTELVSFKKVAFDMYRVDNDPYESLWALQDIDGKQHLVRASDPQFETRKSGDWDVTSDYDKKNVTLSYKNIPITRFSSDEYGFSSNDISLFKSAIIEKSSSSDSAVFIKELLKDQPQNKRDALILTFPELKKFI